MAKGLRLRMEKLRKASLAARASRGLQRASRPPPPPPPPKKSTQELDRELVERITAALAPGGARAVRPRERLDPTPAPSVPRLLARQRRKLASAQARRAAAAGRARQQRPGGAAAARGGGGAQAAPLQGVAQEGALNAALSALLALGADV